jgi:hypothetical protein
MFFDHIILFLNVLEQFAIRVEIFGFETGDIIKYVNFIFYTSDDDYLKDIIAKTDGCAIEDPYAIVREAKLSLDQKIINDTIFQKLDYNYCSLTTSSIKFII